MYKLLLCWRYLRTRYLALVCVVSVMLGVATLIVVNSVMSGFSTKLRDKLHGLLSDVVIESHAMEGFADPQGKMAKIRQEPFLGPRIDAMATALEVFAILQYDYPGGERITRPVRLIGVDPKEREQFGGFKEYLVNPANRSAPSFDLPEDARKRLEFEEEMAQRPSPPKIGIEFGDLPNDLPPPLPPPSEFKLPQGVIVGNLIASYRAQSSDPGKF